MWPLSAGRIFQKGDNTTRESVVAVAGDHVASLRDVDEFRMRDKAHKVLHVGEAHHVAAAAAHQQGRDGNP